MEKVTYKIAGLDCAEETSLLKKVLGTTPGVHELEFDILQSKMIVSYDPSIIKAKQIVELVRTTGMHAIEHDDNNQLLAKSFLSSRLILTFCSGLLLVLGIIFHVLFPLSLFKEIFYGLSIICGIWHVLPKAFNALKRMRPDMHLLMVVAIIGAIAIQEWLEGATVAFLFAVSLFLEQWSVGRARKAIGALMQLSPTTARVIEPLSGTLEEKEVKSVPVGSLIMVKPGEKIPLDGIVEEGGSTVDQSPITGESTPILKEIGDEVFAGTLNTDGALKCRTTKPAADTILARIIQLVDEAKSKRSDSEQWVETFARYYTPIMLVFALLVMIIPPILFAASWVTWIYHGLILLVIACPCALVIATPVSIVCGLTAAARAGILIKGGKYLEEMGKLKAVALDKTGTLTYGKPHVQKIVPLAGHTSEELMRLAVALEQSSEHPLARAILQKAEDMGVQAAIASNFQIVKGKGALATYEGKLFWIGSHRLMHEMGQETQEIHDQALALEDEGHSVIAIGNDAHVCGLISVADQPRQWVYESITAIKSLGIEEVVMLTGDNIPTARALAALTGVDRFHAELLPEEKVDCILALVKQWEKVAMVGDGVNDAPAMAAASVGIAMGAMGSDAAIETADITLMSDDLAKLPWLIRHATRCLRVIKANIVFALSIKALFIALALFNAATLWMAIAADTGAAILVIFNALRLLNKKQK